MIILSCIKNILIFPDIVVSVVVKEAAPTLEVSRCVTSSRLSPVTAFVSVITAFVVVSP